MNKIVSFENISGKKIFNILTEPEASNKKLVIMSHGFRGSSIGPARTFVDFETILVNNGYSVLRFDQPNSGNSEGDFLEVSFNEWVSTIVYFTEKYLRLGYQVGLFGQSMGAAATVIAVSKNDLAEKIPCILLWVPGVNEGDFNGNPDEVFEEAGQKYKGKFWMEARQENFFKCLEKYDGGIHLVYGENDKYVRKELREKVIEIVKAKSQPYMVLKDQDHSPWAYDKAQEVYKQELEFIKKHF